MSNFQEGLYWIRSRDGGTVLDVPSFDTRAQVIGTTKQSTPLFNPEQNLAQLWLVEALQNLQIYRIRNLATGLVLDVQGKSSEEGTPIIAYTQTQNANQHWMIEWVKDEVEHDQCVFITLFIRSEC